MTEKIDQSTKQEPHLVPYIYVSRCKAHPSTKTGLRCKYCSTPICHKCAVQTEVSHSCRPCLKKLRKKRYQKIFNARFVDYIVGIVASLMLAPIALTILNASGTLLLPFFLAPFVGKGLAQFVARSLRRRRGRYLPHVTSGAACIGGFLGAIMGSMSILTFLIFVLFSVPFVYRRLTLPI